MSALKVIPGGRSRLISRPRGHGRTRSCPGGPVDPHTWCRRAQKAPQATGSEPCAGAVPCASVAEVQRRPPPCPQVALPRAPRSPGGPHPPRGARCRPWARGGAPLAPTNTTYPPGGPPGPDPPQRPTEVCHGPTGARIGEPSS
jgi:hypothetical protein